MMGDGELSTKASKRLLREDYEDAYEILIEGLT